MAEGSGEEQAMGAPLATRDVFISYASQDKGVADAVCDALERAGVACWIAPRDVTPGDFYAESIVHAIDSTKVIVLVLSKNGADSQHVLREVERASSKRHPVLSFRIDTAPLPAGLEYFLNTSQWLDTSATGVARSLPRFVDAVKAALAQPATATPVSPGPSATARASRRGRHVLVALTVFVAAALAFLVVDKFWLAKRTPAKQLASAVTPAVTISEKSIAVLPIADMSEKHDQEYFSDGLSEELIDMLAKVPDLKVPARTSSFFFKGKQTTISDIARQLGVTHVMECSVRKSGNKLRVSAQLIRADSGYQLWSETYDRDLRDVFKVQDDIANAVVLALQIKLMGGSLIRDQGGTQNLEAYQLYLHARSEELQNSRASLELSREHLTQATRLDPNFGLAWAWLARNYIRSADSGFLPPKEGYGKGRETARHALKVSPELAEPHTMIGYVFRTYDWDWAGAEAELRQAIEGAHPDVEGFALSGLLLATLGRWNDGEREVRLALKSDPLNPDWYFNLGMVLYGAGRFVDAEASFRRTLELSPDFIFGHLYLAKAQLAQGKTAAALASVQQEREDEPRLGLLSIALQAVGNRVGADAALGELIKRYQGSSAYIVAMTYAKRGDHDLALTWLDRAYANRDNGLAEIVGEPLFKNLWTDPRYKAFLRKLNLPE